MRPSALAVIATVAAALGGLIAVVAADRTGLIDGGTETVFVAGSGAALVERELANPGRAAKPLVGNTFDPATIYRSRSGGVVTIYAYFDDSRPPSMPPRAPDSLSRGEGYVLNERPRGDHGRP